MYFKVLKKGKSFNGGSYTWSLPSKQAYGEWTYKLSGRLSMCNYGYHVTENLNFFLWVERGTQVYVCEIKYKPIVGISKVVTRQVRLLHKVTLTKRSYTNIVNDIREYMLELYKKNEENINGWDRAHYLESHVAEAFSERYKRSYMMRLWRYIQRIRSTCTSELIDKFIMDTIIKHAGLSKYE